MVQKKIVPHETIIRIAHGKMGVSDHGHHKAKMCCNLFDEYKQLLEWNLIKMLMIRYRFIYFPIYQ